MNHLWTWLIVGLVPYSIKRQQKANERILHLRALFWSLEISQCKRGGHDWILRIPLIEQFRL